MNIELELKDRNGRDLKLGQTVKYEMLNCSVYVGVIKFGDYLQNGSRGEYGSVLCKGVYIERCSVKLEPWQDEDDRDWLMPCYEKTISIYEPEWVEII